MQDCCADGVLEASVALVERPETGPSAGAPQNFEEFIYKVWGAGIARHFAIPYNRKLWSVPLREMETSWLGGRVPLPDLEEMIEGALSPSPKPMGPNARFGYPLRGGFQALMDAWLPHLECELRLNSRVERVIPSRHTVTLANGEALRYNHLISTMPLPVLIRQMADEAPARVRAAAARLRQVSVRCVHIGVGRERLTEKHWIYYPEDTVFHRIFVQGNASPYCNPPGGFGLTCEITYSPHKPLPCTGEELEQLCVADCRRVGIIGADDPILVTAQCDLPHAYVVYDHVRAEAVRVIREWLEEQDIVLAGRYSEWEYYNSDHAFLAGKRAAEYIRSREMQSEAPVARPSEKQVCRHRKYSERRRRGVHAFFRGRRALIAAAEATSSEAAGRAATKRTIRTAIASSGRPPARGARSACRARSCPPAPPSPACGGWPPAYAPCRLRPPHR